MKRFETAGETQKTWKRKEERREEKRSEAKRKEKIKNDKMMWNGSESKVENERVVQNKMKRNRKEIKMVSCDEKISMENVQN